MKALLVFAILLSATTALAEIHSGTGTVPWDFSEAAPAPGFLDPWDLGAFITFATAPMATFVSANVYYGAGIAIMPAGVTFEEVTEAPADEAAYVDSHMWVYEERVFVVRTIEGHYAKVRFFDLIYPTEFEYVYQDDGTRSFASPLPAESATWGRIKAIYE